ncbi:MAG TPA: zinc ribbon domain-containing protein [Ktedonobacteraceae bacterium]
MNCTRCNTLLLPEARFCRNCGMPVSAVIPQPATGDNEQANQQVIGDSPTVLPPPWQVQQSAAIQPQYTPQTYQPTVAISSKPGSMPSTRAQLSSPPLPMRRRKNRLMQVLLILLAALLILSLILVGGWFVVLRPYLHGVAQNEVDGDFSSALNLINPLAVAVIATSHMPVIITETDANNFIALNSTQSDPIQQIHMTITPAGVRLEFQTFGLTSTITGVPRVVNGQIVMTNVTVQGVASLIMSPDELTKELNADLQQVSATLHRSIARVVLKNQEMDIQLS